MVPPLHHLTLAKNLPSDTTVINPILSPNDDCNHNHNTAGPSQTILHKASSIEACIGGEAGSESAGRGALVGSHEDVRLDPSPQAGTSSTSSSHGGCYEPLNIPGGEQQQGDF